MKRRIFISADHGLAVVYFLQSDVITTLLDSGVEVILLTDDGLKEQIAYRFGKTGITVEGLRFDSARHYLDNVSPTVQYWLNVLRGEGASRRINVEALKSHLRQIRFEALGKRKMVMLMIDLMIGLMRRSKTLRRWVVGQQMHYSPDLYSDLFERYKPALVVGSTPGWRLDRYLMRQAARLGVPSASVIVGWDNPSSYSLPGAPVDHITCWSQIQKEELVLGSDWEEGRVHIGGIPSYDGYFRKQWLMSREDYFRLHLLDADRKLLGYACSFITFSPNFQNIEAIARLVSTEGALAAPSQLLIRLHPNHFLDEPLFTAERQKIYQLAHELPHVHVVEPVPLGGKLGYYSGEDMPEKTSMMAYSDVFLTVYSTMVVEAAIHGRPIVSVCIDAPGGWNKPGRFSLPLSEIGEWPTHQRFRHYCAGQVANDEASLQEKINAYLLNPGMDEDNRKAFVRDEVTFTDGSAGRRTGEFLLSLLEGRK